MIKAIIFDRDGIIIDSEALHVFSVETSLKKFGIEIDNETREYIIGKHTDHYKEYLLSKYNGFHYDTFRTEQKKIYYEHFANVGLFEDTIEFIKEIKKTGKYLLGLTTSSGRHSTDIVIQKSNLEGYFDGIITKENYDKGKPDPEPYLLTAKQLGVSPDQCLVFEDSDVGVMSAKNAGMTCFAIPNTYTQNHDVSSADKIIRDRKDITIHLLENIRTD